MKPIRITPVAQTHLDEIYAYTWSRWGAAQADDYVGALIETFDLIAADRAPSRVIAADIGVDGFVVRSGKHNIYWRPSGDNAIVVVAILHHRMHQAARLRPFGER